MDLQSILAQYQQGQGGQGINRSGPTQQPPVLMPQNFLSMGRGPFNKQAHQMAYGVAQQSTLPQRIMVGQNGQANSFSPMLQNYLTPQDRKQWANMGMGVPSQPWPTAPQLPRTFHEQAVSQASQQPPQMPPQQQAMPQPQQPQRDYSLFGQMPADQVRLMAQRLGMPADQIPGLMQGLRQYRNLGMGG